MQIQILTYEINNYDQYGEYFLAAFNAVPSVQQLAEVMRGNGDMPADIMEAIALLEHIRKGGGRQGAEYRWFNLRPKTLHKGEA